MTSWWGDSVADQLLAYLYTTLIGPALSADAGQVAQAFRVSQGQAAEELEELARRGFLTRIDEPPLPRYRLDLAEQVWHVEQYLEAVGLGSSIRQAQQVRQMLAEGAASAADPAEEDDRMLAGGRRPW